MRTIRLIAEKYPPESPRTCSVIIWFCPSSFKRRNFYNRKCGCRNMIVRILSVCLSVRVSLRFRYALTLESLALDRKLQVHLQHFQVKWSYRLSGSSGQGSRSQEQKSASAGDLTSIKRQSYYRNSIVFSLRRPLTIMSAPTPATSHRHWSAHQDQQL